ncbi:major pollen allergen Ole e 10-like [Aristolochia californica]|uniref:major pollen allergen Ole e 10-like n=1 Tax=Aristolochia californica TaxID=171875 RepID=UPI0035DBDBEC
MVSCDQRREASAMRQRFWFLHGLLVFGCYLAYAMGTSYEKVESTVPLTTNTPPEGNTTFLGGTSWCVALPGVSQVDLQNALDWACGLGMADCGPIQAGGPCFDPDTLVSHASYAFNSYYQQNGNSDIACNFGGTGSLSTRDPSYGSCFYPNSGPVASSSSPLYNRRLFLWMLFGTVLQLLRNLETGTSTVRI